MIQRHTDAAQINELINHPTIRPTVGGEGVLDISDLVGDERNVCLANEHGGAIFVWSGPRIYHGHSFFLVRGRKAIRLGKAMLEQMGEHADLIWGLTPANLNHARWFNRQVGMTSLGLMQTPEGPCELFEMRY